MTDTGWAQAKLQASRSWAANLRFYPNKITRVLTAVVEAKGPVLVHCAGGRDRTGMICSMLLVLAGVTSEAVVGNYEAGFRGAARVSAKRRSSG